MNRMISEAMVAYGFAERQFILLRGYWMWEVVWIVYGIAMTLSIGFLGVGVQRFSGGGQLKTNELILYLLTGSLLWGYLAGLFWDVSNVVSWERWEGTIEYPFMAPISRITHILGMSLFSIVYGVAQQAVHLVGRGTRDRRWLHHIGGEFAPVAGGGAVSLLSPGSRHRRKPTRPCPGPCGLFLCSTRMLVKRVPRGTISSHRRGM